MRLAPPHFHRWLAAEKQLQRAERELWHATMTREGEQPPAAPHPALVAEVAALRSEVHALFRGAMDEMRQLRESLHQRSGFDGDAARQLPGDIRSTG